MPNDANDGATVNDDAANVNDDANSSGNQSGDDSPKTFTQEQVNSLIRDRLKREKESLKTAIVAELNAAAEEEKKRKAGEWEALVASKDKEIAALLSAKERADKYDELATKRFEEAKKNFPEALLLLAPDDDATPLEKETWYTNKAIPALAKMEKESGKPKTGVNGDDDPEKKKKKREDTMEEIARHYRRNGAYTF